MKIVCVIPTYNCAMQIPRVLDKLADSQWKNFHEIWVIDNGSLDGTPITAKEVGTKLGIQNLKVFTNSRNVNLGGTHKIAFREANKVQATHVLILHGDDQADANECDKLIKTSKQNGGCTVLGSRFMRGSRLSGYVKSRVIGNRVLNLIYSTVTGRWLTDLGSGLNLFSIEDVQDKAVENFGNSLSFNYELILLLVRSKKEFRYVPISWSETDQVSNARNFRIFYSALEILWSWILRSSRNPEENRIIDVRCEEIR